MLPWIDDITQFIFLEDTPQPADIIFVPGNGHAEPSELAAQLYREGFAPYLLPSGKYTIGQNGFVGQKSGSQRYDGAFDTEWAFMRHVMMQNDVPESAILREDEATFTYQNAILSRRRTDLARIAIRTGIICCQPTHARRAKMYYQTLYPDVRLLVCPTRSAVVNRSNWMQTPEGIDAVLSELSRCGSQFGEIMKMLARQDALR